MNHIKRTRVSLSVGDHTASSQVGTSGHHAQVTSVTLDETSNFAGLQIDMSGVVHLDEGTRVRMGHTMRDSFCAQKIFLTLHHSNLASLGVTRKATLGVAGQTEVLSGLVDADDIHQTSGGGYVCSDVAINLNEPLLADLLYVISC